MAAFSSETTEAFAGVLDHLDQSHTILTKALDASLIGSAEHAALMDTALQVGDIWLDVLCALDRTPLTQAEAAQPVPEPLARSESSRGGVACR